MSNAYPHRNLYTRLKACAHGVGVFAIRDIPAGMRLFKGDSGAIVRVPRAAVDRIADAGIASHVFRFLPERGRCLYCASRFQPAHDGMVFELFGQPERRS